ncbi:MAG TPA: hypothetical protein VM658_12450 [bacterium]|nr:hypothetical protein [bacterium]
MKMKVRQTLRPVSLFWSALFLLAASPAGHDRELYWATAADVPEWAEQGNFRFIRIDGGRIETMKAERTWWGKEFSQDEKDVLTNIYGGRFDKMLALLQEARFNWIWVTWSNGWSLQEESENREQLKKVIARCHENNIHVTAYMSATNMFWKSTFKDDPETVKYGLFMYGLPIFYAGLPKTGPQVNFARRLADVRFAGWRAYLVNKAALAVDAGVDAIFFDNIIGDTEGMKILLSEAQRMAEEKARANGRPKVMVYANVHISPSRFAINGQAEVIWEEAGKDTPGVWDGKWRTDNARKIKFLAGEKQPWQPLMYEYDVYHCGPRERCIPGPTEHKLAIAEAASFGAALSRNIEGRFLDALIRDEPEARAAWAAIAQYNSFIADHAELFHNVVPAARIALLSNSEKNPVADYFIQNNVIFETKVLKRIAQGRPLREFMALVVPFKIGALDDEQRGIIADFYSAGGVIFAAEPESLAARIGLSDRGRMRSLPSPGPDLSDAVQSATGGPLLTVSNTRFLAANVTKKADANTFIVHLINYDAAPNEKVKVTLDLGDDSGAVSAPEMKIFSPDEYAPSISDVSLQGGVLTFSIDKIMRYAVMMIHL